MGSDNEVGTTGVTNKILNKANKKRAAAVARDYGAVTDTDGLLRIMECDPFRRLGISL